MSSTHLCAYRPQLQSYHKRMNDDKTNKIPAIPIQKAPFSVARCSQKIETVRRARDTDSGHPAPATSTKIAAQPRDDRGNALPWPTPSIGEPLLHSREQACKADIRATFSMSLDETTFSKFCHAEPHRKLQRLYGIQLLGLTLNCSPTLPGSEGACRGRPNR